MSSKIFLCLCLLFLLVKNGACIDNSNKQLISTPAGNVNPAIIQGLDYLYPNGYRFGFMKTAPSISPDYTHYLEIYPKDKNNVERLIIKAIGRTKYARERTLQRTKMAGDLGISPKVRWSSPDYQFMILEFVDGDLNHLIRPDFLEKVAVNFRKFHDHYKNTSHFPEVYTISTRTWNRKKEILSKEIPIPLGFEDIFKVLKEIDDVLTPWDQAMPIHGDATYANILTTKENVFFIDWGDSVTSDPFDDLAMFANDYALTDEEQEVFLKAYVGSDVSRPQRSKLYFKRLQALLHQSLWYLLVAHEHTKNGPIFSLPFMSWIINMGDPLEILAVKREMHSYEVFPDSPTDYAYLGLLGIRHFIYQSTTADFKKHKIVLEKGKK